jgi:TATA-box binding protein (TBP) (component of TFIID and TFIIIB)
MAAKPSKVRDAIDQAIRSSNEVREGNYVSVGVEKTGFLFFGSSKIVLTGRTKSEKDKAKVEEIANQNSSGVEVESRLRVSQTS